MNEETWAWAVVSALNRNAPFIFPRPSENPNPRADPPYPEVNAATGPVGPPNPLAGGALQPYLLPGNAFAWPRRAGWPDPGDRLQVPDYMEQGLGDWVYPPGLPGPDVTFHTLEAQQILDARPSILGLTDGGLRPRHPNFFMRFRHVWAPGRAYECRPTAAPDAWKNRADTAANRNIPGKWIQWNDFVFEKYAVEELANPVTPLGAPNARRHLMAYRLAIECTLESPSHAYSFKTMKDLYFFLLHIGQAGRATVHSICIADPFSGPCVSHACKLLTKCPSLTRFSVGKCIKCQNCRVPARAWKAWKGVRLRHGRPQHPTVGAPNVDDGAFNFECRTAAACGQCRDKAGEACVPRTRREREWAAMVVVSQAARHRAARSKRYQVLFDSLNK